MSKLFLISGTYRVLHYMGSNEDEDFSYIVEAETLDDAIVSVAKMVEDWSSDYCTSYYVNQITSSSSVIKQSITDADREKYSHLY